MVKQRIDLLLVEKGFYPSRERAKRAIMAGQVLVGEERIDKPGTLVDKELNIRIKGDSCPFVSRGGLKLEKAFRVFPIQVKDLVVMDVGASTGGFTDCLLQNGAAKVYAIDVGYGQLDWKLRKDPRVVVMERTNIRYLSRDKLDELVQFATVDVSFISLTKVFKNLLSLMEDGAQIISLIKPQFEVGRTSVGKRGVVRDFQVHIDLLQSLLPELQNFGVGLKALDFSPIRGPKGNVEYLVHFSKNSSKIFDEHLITNTVEAAKNFFF